MVNCDRCGKKFDWQYLLDKHLARKFPCKEQNPPMMEQNPPTMEDFPPKMEDFPPRMEQIPPRMEDFPPRKGKQCEYCLDYFTRLDKHRCKLEYDGIRILERQLNIKPDFIPKDKCRFCNIEIGRSDHLARHFSRCSKKREYKEELEKKISDQNTAQTINNTTNNNNCHNTTNVHIHMNAFGKENLDYITRNVILKLCRKAHLRDEIIPRIARQIHCNPDHPENHNIVVSNLRAPYARVYNGENYNVESTKDIIDKVMDNVTGLLTDQQCDDKDGKFQQYDRAITRIEEDMNETESKFKSEQRVKVKNSLYNNKNMLEKTMKSV